MQGKVLCHVKTVLKHKWHVFKCCRKAGLTWRGVKHDMSKFSPTEFSEGVRYCTGTRSPIVACKEAEGMSLAWMHHKGRNTHHYEYWVDNLDGGGTPLRMPYRDALEQVCDFIGAGRAYMGDGFSYGNEYIGWWVPRMEGPLAMHPQTVAFVDEMLHTMMEEDSDDVLRPERSMEVYLRSVDGGSRSF